MTECASCEGTNCLACGCRQLHTFHVPDKLEQGNIPEGVPCCCGQLSHERYMTEKYIDGGRPRHVITNIEVVGAK